MKATTFNVAVIGSGLIGRGWSIVFARAGFPVRLYDPDPQSLQRAIELIASQADMLVEYGLAESVTSITDRIEATSSLEDAVTDVGYVQECAPEVVDVKQEIFADLDRLTPSDAILASSTSAIVASLFTGNLKGRSRMLVVHPVNPPHLVPLVEISPAEWTDQDVIERTQALMERVNQTPIMVNGEIEGFILNRLQVAVLNEAMRLVDGGFVSPSDLDKTIRDGLGLRWSFMGPFETIDLNAPGGTRDYAARYSDFFARVVDSQSTQPDWNGEGLTAVDEYNRQHRALEEISACSEWRDRRLAALRAHKREQQNS